MKPDRKLFLLLIVLCAACQPIAAPATPTATPEPAQLPTASPQPSSTPPPSPTPPPAATTAPTAQPPSPTPADTAGDIDAYLTSLANTGEFSGAVLVARDSQILLSKGYGLADRAQAIPNTPQTRFSLCSVTKQFTAMAVLMLQDQGLLNVEDSVCTYLSPCPPDWEAITLHHLLTHTSGIPEFVDLPEYEATKDIPTTPEQLIARFSNLALEFKPGASWRYSNSGYLVLGYVIELVTGQSYGSFIEEHIFVPLHMDGSGYDHKLVPMAVGYTGTGDQWIPADDIDASVPYAAGALYSTVADMYRWDQALYTEQLIPKDPLDAMARPYDETPLGFHGYGVFTDNKHGQRVIRHGGAGDGFISVIERYPGQRVALILLSNRETTDLGAITDAVGKLVFGR